MFRNLIVILAGGLLLANPLTAQECCDKDKAAKPAASDCTDKKGDCESMKGGCDSMAAGSGCASGTVAATVSQDAPSDLAKGLAALATKSFSFDLALDAKEGPQATTVNANLAFGDAKHFSANISFTQGVGETATAMKFEIVADGSFLYYHMDGDQAPPGMDYGKVNMDTIGKVFAQGIKQAPFPVLDEKGAVSASSIDKALSMSGMKIVRDAEKGTIMMTLVKPMAEGENAPTVVVTLDGKNYMPISIVATESEKSSVNVNFSNVMIMKDLAAFGENAFKFVVPEGITVMDLTMMLQSQLGAMGGMEDEEEELEF